MTNRSRISHVALVFALVGGMTLPAHEAQAGFGFGSFFRAVVGGGGGYHRGGGRPRGESRAARIRGGGAVAGGAAAGAAGGAALASTDASETDSTLARYDNNAPDRVAVFKSITLKSALTTVGAEKSSLGVAVSNDYQRDYDAALERFMDAFDGAKLDAKTSVSQGRAVVVVQNGGTSVTRNTIDRLVATAYENSGLGRFESFAEENWTSARLKVAILNRARGDAFGMVSGPSAGAVRYEDVEDAINRSAKAVYQNVFELSEILALNRALERFNQTAIEHGYFETTALGSGSERWVTDAAELVLTPAAAGGSETDKDRQALTDIRKAIGQTAGDDQNNALRYRAQRVAVDCFVEKMIASDTGVIDQNAPKIDLAQRTRDLARSDCRGWVKNVVNGSDLRKPMPQRVVWQEDGTALANTSMYSRPPSAN